MNLYCFHIKNKRWSVFYSCLLLLASRQIIKGFHEKNSIRWEISLCHFKPEGSETLPENSWPLPKRRTEPSANYPFVRKQLPVLRSEEWLCPCHNNLRELYVFPNRSFLTGLLNDIPVCHCSRCFMKWHGAYHVIGGLAQCFIKQPDTAGVHSFIKKENMSICLPVRIYPALIRNSSKLGFWCFSCSFYSVFFLFVQAAHSPAFPYAVLPFHACIMSPPKILIRYIQKSFLFFIVCFDFICHTNIIKKTSVLI